MKFKMFITALFLCLRTPLFAQSPGGFMAVANVSKIHGAAFINKEQIKVGAEIAEGMILTIPKASDFVEVKFQNGHLVRFVGAKVKVAQLNPKNTLLELIKGKIFSAIKPLTPNETYNIKTSRASFGVRGTQFMIEEAKKQTYLCVCEGVVNTKTAIDSIDVKKDEDVTLAAKRELKASLATEAMITMTKSVFKDMGL
jgi:hypothetical protein